MTDAEEREFALREHDRMVILASEIRQLGMFPALAQYLKDNAAAAFRWATRPADAEGRRKAPPRARR